MVRTVVFLCAVASCLASPDTSPVGSRIAGGVDTTIEQHPYQLSVQQQKKHICGATIISAIWALTTASCIERTKPNEFNLLAGTSDLGSEASFHRVAQVIIHTGFDISLNDYDIAAVRVFNPFRWSDSVKAVVLPAQAEDVPAGTNCTVSGWGELTYSGNATDILQEATVTVFEDDDCPMPEDMTLTSRMICAANLLFEKGPCSGDEGGALMADGKMIGILSWARTCDLRKRPDIYTRVSALRVWIQSNTGV